MLLLQSFVAGSITVFIVIFVFRSVLNPFAAIFGGIIGQEVVKAVSNKYTPLFQVTNPLETC